MKQHPTLPLALTMFFCLLSPAFESVAQHNGVDIKFHQRIPMRDGVNLSATIYQPSKNASPLPVILVMTPYVQQLYSEYGFYFAKNEFVFVYADSRGRGDSEGVFVPFENDGKDGYDAIEWIAKQPWCNGKIGMMGGSYMGTVQWLTLIESPPSLYSIAPTASVAPGIDFPFYNNIFSHYAAQWLNITGGKTNDLKLNESDYWDIKKREVFNEHIPFSEYSDMIGFNTPVFNEWIRHPNLDEYWKNKTPSVDNYQTIDIPTLTITGYFDGDQQGALHYHSNLLQNASKSATDKAYLVIGPWNHFGTAFPSSELGGLKFGENTILDIKKIHLDWFEWTLKDHQKPDFFKDHVYYYEMGTNEWNYAHRLKEISNDWDTLYFSSDHGRAGDVFDSGKLNSTIQNNSIPDSIIYNPLDITSDDSFNTSEYLSDQSDAFKNGRLIYHSPPFKEDVTIGGNIKVNVYLKINTPDTDIEYNIYEINPKGESIFLTSDKMRARYRISPTQVELLSPKDINLFEFDSEFFFVRRIPKGSRLRIVINALNSPDYQKNYNSGKDVSLETRNDSRTATIKLFHNKKHPSCIILPLIR